jgi:hypothetical protein
MIILSLESFVQHSRRRWIDMTPLSSLSANAIVGTMRRG